MQLKSIFTDSFSRIKSLEKAQQKNLFYSIVGLFLVLFSYPIVRSTIDSIFLETYRAEKTPLVWIYSVLTLSVTVWIYNKFQARMSIQRLYFLTSIFSCIFIWLCAWLVEQGIGIWAYPLYVWKEVYIVILVHVIFAYMNTCVDVEAAKVVYGPVGAITALGGILGGLVTTELTFWTGQVNMVLAVGNVLIFVSALFFLGANENEGILKKDDDKSLQQSPLGSIADVKKYVFYIALVVALSQFCISLANFKFNLLFDAIVHEKIIKTRYLGKIYSAVNLLSMVVQFALIPVLFKLFKIKSIHQSVPWIYIVVAFLGLMLGGSMLLPVASAYVIYKGLDYSLFSTAKEMLYFDLDKNQKYGAKYITDMVVYRAAKGAISFVLLFLQSSTVINILLITCLLAWVIALKPLFEAQAKLKIN